ncbi:toxin-antitoxin system YwqK family antitoxin [Gaetbulibacter sp. M235]|uniref:toxin-antitoxin system YwqK family antitoxin n=1 Tax=Gaetbulibacter sp. M235 TaxID=3126510 RepID=UPI00374FB6AE
MKKVFVSIFIFAVGFISAQTINQLDADGMRHGIWKKYYENTTILRYEGEFNHGKEIGLFKYYKNVDQKASLTATKQFNETNNKSYVTFFTSKGKVVSEGQMDGKLYIGEWKYYQKNSNKLLTLENYDDEGLLNGDRSVYYENGQIAEKQFYVHGQLEGDSVWYSEKNIVLKEFQYVNGVLHGLSKFYNPKGELILEGSYKRGKKDGIWKTYENGKLIEEKDFTYKPKYIKKT